jgi:hypothetical protein
VAFVEMELRYGFRWNGNGQLRMCKIIERPFEGMDTVSLNSDWILSENRESIGGRKSNTWISLVQ